MIRFDRHTRYPSAITILTVRLSAETDPAERAVLEARIEERRSHNRARRTKAAAAKAAREGAGKPA